MEIRNYLDILAMDLFKFYKLKSFCYHRASIDTSEDWYVTPLAKDRPLASCYSKSYYLQNCKGAKKWTGGWPPKLELPEDQRRDTACPYTFRNETRKRIQRWPDIIGLGIPKCGTGRLWIILYDLYIRLYVCNVKT